MMLLIRLVLLLLIVEVTRQDDLLYPFGLDEGDVPGPFWGYSSGLLDFNHTVRYFKRNYDKIYMCAYGVLSFGEAINCGYHKAKEDWAFSTFKKDIPVAGPPLVAAFWALQNVYKEDISQWDWAVYRYYHDYYYKVTEPNERLTYRTTTDPVLLARAKDDILYNFPNCSGRFEPRELGIVTWDDVIDLNWCKDRGLSKQRCDCIMELDYPYINTYDDISSYCNCVWLKGFSEDYCRCSVDYAQYNYDSDYGQVYCGCILGEGKPRSFCWCWTSQIMLYGSNNTAATNHCSLYLKRVATLDRQLETPKKRKVNHKRGSNTYQVVVATNGRNDAYVMLNYEAIKWARSNNFHPQFLEYYYDPHRHWATVGFNKGDGVKAYSHPYSGSEALYKLATDSNVNMPGRWIYKISGWKLVDPDCNKMLFN